VCVDAEKHTALAEFKEKGRILQGKQVLFVSSISGLVAMSPQNQSAYNGSKAALTMMAKV
jgi:NAD(P)-dependent dehydrogenase (short-subunit alcohol dehydrogenase family)